MTDAEIINLLECCSKSTCSDCGYSKECDGYSSVNFALDLINRLKAEIEKLNNDLAISKKEIKRYATATTNHKHHKEKHCFLKHTLLHIVIHLLFHLVLHGVLEHIIH